MKLYLNGFAQTRFDSREQVAGVLGSDLAKAFAVPLRTELFDLAQLGGGNPMPGRSLDKLDVAIDIYEREPELLGTAERGSARTTAAATRPTHRVGGARLVGKIGEPLEVDRDGQSARIAETWHTHLFRSLCPITGQPDWASVLICYAGVPIDPEGLLKYLISFRRHAAFHEDTVERIFVDLMRRCAPHELTVYGRFQRRGGLDINPFRSNVEHKAPVLRLVRQ